MTKLTNFIYCLNAERVGSNNGTGDGINALGVLSNMLLEFIPGTFSYSIIFTILGMDFDCSNRIRIVLKDPVDKVVIDTGETLLPPISNGNSTIPNEYSGLNMSMDLRNVIFETKGVYKTEVYFNGKLLKSNEIYVDSKR